jgi:hypothetical protein
VCDQIDNDCDGEVDEGAICGCVPSVERCDGIDNDCDGFVDEEGGCVSTRMARDCLIVRQSKEKNGFSRFGVRENRLVRLALREFFGDNGGSSTFGSSSRDLLRQSRSLVGTLPDGNLLVSAGCECIDTPHAVNVPAFRAVFSQWNGLVKNIVVAALSSSTHGNGCQGLEEECQALRDAQRERTQYFRGRMKRLIRERRKALRQQPTVIRQCS